MSRRYTIYRLSAKAMLGYAKETENNIYTFDLNADATARCKVPTATHEQEDTALFFQMLCVLHGDDYVQTDSNEHITDLSDAICFIDFAEIFDRDGSQPRYALRQKKAESMFRPEGITLDFGSGKQTYVAFERSASMSRNARLSFIRKDLYEPVRRRIMMDMDIGLCQLSKLYAYNGLMLSGGTRIDSIDIDKPHRVIVVDNNTIDASTRVITVDDVTGHGAVRQYNRVERVEQFIVTEFDGEGIISKEYAKRIDKVFCGEHCHSSFQIRMPYVKGMLHEVDFKDYFKSGGTYVLKDIWGEEHPVDDVDIILTKSMFKGYGWLGENGMTWADYMVAFRKYRHALYITAVNKENPERFTQMNYQFLNTLSMTSEEFRPVDLPLGWDHDPEEDERQWITKQTETEYYRLCADEDYRKQYFLKVLNQKGVDRKSKTYHLAKILQKNPLFINESIFADELADHAESIYKDYALGTLLIEGDNRFLSSDLLRFLVLLCNPDHRNMNARQRTFYAQALSVEFQKQSFYAPKAAYTHDDVCTLLRNPHIARNEELQLYCYSSVEQMRKHYLGHLSDVVMVDSSMYAAERLGGADYDGDMIKTIANPILNACVQRNYEGDTTLKNIANIPFLKIPSAEAQLRDANDWYARFETVKSTFSSRIGQISNAALTRSLIAYNENSDAADRQRCREETETLAILTGLEIDSSKSGVKPDLSQYLERGKRQKTVFLRYKYMIEKNGGRSEYYEPTPKQKLKAFIENTDWSKVDSNVERLPYYAYMLREHTPRIKAKPQPPEKLFAFAVDEHWRDTLDKGTLTLMSEIIGEYDACLARIRVSKAKIQDRPKKTDIDRILYSRGQEELYDVDELYAVFSALEAHYVRSLRLAIREQSWQWMDETERELFLQEHLPEEIVAVYSDLLCDFRQGGYRILGDLICDIDDANNATERKVLTRDGDSVLWQMMIAAYETRRADESYRDAVARGCRTYLETKIKPGAAVKYAVALGKKSFVWDVLLDKVAENALSEKKVPHD